MADFVHLHLHSEYSLLDGACRIREIPKAAKAAGHRAVAITDHGVMYGAVAFFRACREEGIKPIIGCEVYVAPRSLRQKEGKGDTSGYHLILLVKNEVGYRNLIAMVSTSFIDGFYAKPRIDLDLLERHSEGLIALSACLAGAIPQMILLGNLKGAEEYALRLKAIFQDDFYLELQDHGLTDERKVASALIALSQKTDIPLVVTNDVHYLKRSDAEAQATMMCIQTNSVIADGRPLGFETDEFYYKTTEEMAALFPNVGEALENTVKIADKCNFSFTFGKVHMPSFPIPAGTTHGALLARYTEEGFLERVRKGQIDFSYGSEREYRERIAYELSVVGEMGFDGYFLIARDFIMYAKGRDIPVGPGRGSGAGSMVAYCAGITDIDPFRYGLLFERFLNPERTALPDFDTDICYVRREEVIAYVKEKYGEEHVAQIITFGTLSARAAVRDVGRALGVPYAEVDAIAKLIPQGPKILIKNALAAPELREKYESSETVKRLLDMAMALEGMPRHASTHAAGVLITEEPLSETLPLATNGDAIVTQYDMDTVAELGLVKFDLLGLRYITVIRDAERAVQQKDPTFSIEGISFDDPATYALLGSGRTDGVFQLESGGMRRLLSGMRPRSIYDITAAIALYRPGPMDSIPHFLACREGKEAPAYEVPELAEILGDTDGCIVYQEQVMQIFRRLAGYSYARADIVRRAMSKKKSKAMADELEGFCKGTAERGIPRDVSEKIFARMFKFAEYAFNKSHAAAYATLSYRTAYLKAHYPSEYLAALLTSVLGDQNKMAQYIADAQRMGIAVLPPDINESRKCFSVTGANIRFSLLALRNVGAPFVDAIVSEREKRRFESFGDFLDRMSPFGVNRRQIESLIKCGAFDTLGVFRSRLLSSYEKMLDELSERHRSNITGQLDIFSVGDAPIAKETVYPDIPEFELRELLVLEKESTGMYFSGHLMDDYRDRLEGAGCVSILDVVSAFSEGEEDNEKFYDGMRLTIGGIITRANEKALKNGSMMRLITIEDRHGEMNAVAFGKVNSSYGKLLVVNSLVVLAGKLTVKDGEKPELLIYTVSPLSEESKQDEKNAAARLFLRVPAIDSDTCRRALRVLDRYRGDTEVVLYDNGLAKYLSAAGYRVTVSESLLSELSRILGGENVILK